MTTTSRLLSTVWRADDRAPLALLIVLLVPWQVNGQVASQSRAYDVDHVGALVLADIAARENPRLLEFTDIRASYLDIELMPTAIAPIPVYRIRYRAGSHPTFYLVGAGNEGPIPLGGFLAPDVVRLDRVASAVDASWRGLDVRNKARAISVLVDPRGAEDYHFPSDCSPGCVDEPSKAWLRQAPEEWPSDTMVALPTGGAVVGVTRLSRQRDSWAAGWIAEYCQFVFDRERNLLAAAIGARTAVFRSR